MTGLLIYFVFQNQIFAQTSIVHIENQMRIDKNTGLPAAIYNVNSGQYSGSPEQIARQYLLDNKELLGMEDNLSDLELIEIKESPAGKHVGFRQAFKGIPVMRSEIVVSINHQNRVGMVINGHKPDIFVNTAPSIDKNQALNLSKQALGAEQAIEIFPSRTKLMVYEDSLHVFHLVWKVLVFPNKPDGEWLVIVDAHSSEIFEKFNTVINYEHGTGRVFDPDPGTELRDSTLLDQNDEDYPELQPAYDNVTLFDLNDAIGGVYKVRGRYVWSEDIVVPYDDIMEEDDPDDFTYNRSQNGFEEVNIYYVVDKHRRYLGTLGFSPTWDYLSSGSEAIAFDARATTARNAYYSPTQEYMYFGVPSSDVDAGEDEEVILHEYGHALHDALIIGGTDNASPGSDTRGVSEGIADYSGISYRRSIQPNDPYRPNHRSNWFKPTAGTSIRLPANAKYPTHWGSSCYDKMKVWASTLMDMEYINATNPPGNNLGRDKTHRLMLTSLSYVTSSANVQDNVYAILQAERDIPEYSGEDLHELANIFYNRGFFYSNEVSGTIYSNTTWSGYKLVTGDVTVNSGVTLTIYPGTFIFLEDDKSIIVNGALNAQGTETNPITFTRSGTSAWDRIRLNSGSNEFEWCIFDGGNCNVDIYSDYNSFSNCTSKNANTGFHFSNTYSGSVSNSQIYTNSVGIALYQSRIEIQNCSIYNNTSHGLQFYQNNYMYGSTQILDNQIHDNGYDGISLYESSPDILRNEIYNNQCGISGNSNSSPYLAGYYQYGENLVYENDKGLEVYGYCNPFLGQETCGGGHNQFYSNTYHIWAQYDCYVTAEVNFWDSHYNKFIALYGSTIDIIPYLDFPPLDKGSSSDQDMVKSSSINDMGGYDDKWNIEQKLLYARNIAHSGDIKESQKICKDIIESYPDSALSFFALDIIWESSRFKNSEKGYDLESFSAYLKDLASKKNKKELYGYSELLYSGFEKEKTLSIADKIYTEYQNTFLAEISLFRKFMYFFHDKNDMVMAKQLANQLEDEFPKSISARKANEFISSNSQQLAKNTTDKNSSEPITISPAKYELSQNYPNPFNPSSRVKYALPEASNIQIAVYNSIGQKIKSFKQNQQPCGVHFIRWDGKNDAGLNVPSGLYILRFNAVSLEADNQSFTKSIKMLLLR